MQDLLQGTKKTEHQKQARRVRVQPLDFFSFQAKESTPLEKELFSLSSELGLNSYEASAYSSLCLQGPMAAQGVAKASGIPRSRVYETLSSLESKGLASVQALPMEKAKKFTALGLEDAVSLLSQEVHERLSGIRQRALEASEKLSSPRGKESEVEAFECATRATALGVIAARLRNAKSEVLVSSPSLQATQGFFMAVRKAKSNGVEVYALGGVRKGSFDGLDRFNAECSTKCVEDCQEFYVIDSTVFVAIDSGGKKFLKLNGAAAVQNFKKVFRVLWEAPGEAFQVQAPKPQSQPQSRAFSDWEERLTVDLWRR